MDKVTKNANVPIPLEKAFDNFVNKLNEWWPKEYSWSQKDLVEIKIDPKKNGLCSEIGPHGFRCDWGRVTKIDPNKEIAFNWQISPQRVPEPNPDKSSEVKVVFKELPGAEACIELEHSGFEKHGDGSAAYQQAMDSEYGWRYILNAYTDYCKSKNQ